jgi:serine/threonine protein kinase
MLRRGQAEAQLLHRLPHPNIVEVSRAGIEEGLLFIVTELLRGRALSAVLDEHGRLSVEEVLYLCAQIGRRGCCPRLQSDSPRSQARQGLRDSAKSREGARLRRREADG